MPSLSLATLLHISVYTWSGISAFDMKTKEHVGQDSKGLAVLSLSIEFVGFFPVSLFYFLFSRILSVSLFTVWFFVLHRKEDDICLAIESAKLDLI